MPAVHFSSRKKGLADFYLKAKIINVRNIIGFSGYGAKAKATVESLLYARSIEPFLFIS